jgi:hypothetical protein
MAGADYRSCDKCGAKTFYDANLPYEYVGDNDDYGKKITKEMCTRYVGEPDGVRLYRVGDWAVLCEECAKTHETKIVKRRKL